MKLTCLPLCRPEAFGGELPKSSNYIEDDLLPPSDSEDEDDLAFRVVNVNKGSQLYEHSSEDEEEEEEEEGEGEEGTEEGGEEGEGAGATKKSSQS